MGAREYNSYITPSQMKEISDLLKSFGHPTDRAKVGYFKLEAGVGGWVSLELHDHTPSGSREPKPEHG